MTSISLVPLMVETPVFQTGHFQLAGWLTEKIDNSADKDFSLQLNLPSLDGESFSNTVGDIHLLPKVLDAANRFENRTSDEVMKTMMEETRLSSLFGIGG